MPEFINLFLSFSLYTMYTWVKASLVLVKDSETSIVPTLLNSQKLVLIEKNPIWLWVKWHFWGRNELFLFTLQTHYFKLQLHFDFTPSWCFTSIKVHSPPKVQDGSTFRLSHFNIYFSNFVLCLWEIHWFLVKICHCSLTLFDGQKWVSLTIQKQMVWR